MVIQLNPIALARHLSVREASIERAALTPPLQKIVAALSAAFVSGLGATAAVAEVPAPGCYERVYDAAHLAAHRGQLVVRATVLVKEPDAVEAAKRGPDHVPDAQLRLWVKGQKPSFDSFGACRPANGGLICQGSLSAAEADACKTSSDGIHGNCRIDAADAGAFGVVARAGGLMVTVLRRLELVPAPYDGGPFLYLSPGNVENHAFVLKPAPEQACRVVG
jgi:hypothetical protein